MRIAFFLIVLTALGTMAVAEPPVKISKETTFYVEPIQKNGLVDYLAAVEHATGGRDVPPDRNVFAGLLEVAPVAGWDEGYLAQLCKRLDWKPEEAREVLVSFPDFVAEHGAHLEGGEEGWSDLTDPAYWNAGESLGRTWLDMYSPVIEKAASALQRESYFSPLIRREEDACLHDILLPHLSYHRAVARTLMSQALRDMADGDLDRPVRNYILLRRLACFQTQELLVISNLVGFSIDSLAESLCREILRYDGLSRDHLLRIDLELRRLPRRGGVRDALDKGDRVQVLEMLGLVAAGDRGLFYRTYRFAVEQENDLMRGIYSVLEEVVAVEGFICGEVMRRLNQKYDALASAPRGGGYLDLLEWESEYESDLGHGHDVDRIDRLLEEMAAEDGARRVLERVKTGEGTVVVDAVVWILSELMISGQEAVMKTERQLEEFSEVLRVARQVALYGFDEGRYPDSLSDLVPKYLDAVPRGMTDGQPFAYKQLEGGYGLYSTGSDGEDDGGIDDLRHGDVAVWVGVDEPGLPDRLRVEELVRVFEQKPLDDRLMYSGVSQFFSRFGDALRGGDAEAVTQMIDKDAFRDEVLRRYPDLESRIDDAWVEAVGIDPEMIQGLGAAWERTHFQAVRPVLNSDSVAVVARQWSEFGGESKMVYFLKDDGGGEWRLFDFVEIKSQSGLILSRVEALRMDAEQRAANAQAMLRFWSFVRKLQAGEGGDVLEQIAGIDTAGLDGMTGASVQAMLAGILLDVEQPQAALDLVNQVVVGDHVPPIALLVRGDCLNELGRADEALVMAQRYAKQVGLDAAVWLTVGDAYLAKDEFWNAKGAYRRAAEDDPYDREALLKWLLWVEGDDDREAFAAVYRQIEDASEVGQGLAQALVELDDMMALDILCEIHARLYPGDRWVDAYE